MRIRTVMYGLLFSTLTLHGSYAVAQPAQVAATPQDQFRLARELISLGRYDLAAEQLKAMAAANPTDADYLAIQERYGPTAFERLKLVLTWSDNPAAQANAVQAVDTLIAGARKATGTVNRDPARIARFVRNLGASREERRYAEDQLAKAGAAAVPPMVNALLTTENPDLRAGIIAAVRRLGIDTVPGFLAAVEGMPDDIKAGLLSALTSRPDVVSQAAYAGTNPLPWLWYYSSAPAGETPFVRSASLEILRRLVGDAKSADASSELVALARPFYDRTARYAELDRTPDAINVWVWDPTARNVKPVESSELEAGEYYGLRNLRWALEREPSNARAQQLFLALAAERSVERTGFDVISQSDPGVYQLLAATPTATLVNMLDGAMADKKTALAFALTQALADRADKTVAAPTETTTIGGRVVRKPSILADALGYPDPNVQLAAAIGLLRSPGEPVHGRQARVVEVLRRAIAADTPAPGTTDNGRALIADPDDFRSDKLAGYVRALGLTPERVGTGRALLRRVAHASDFDLILVDQHIGGLELRDTLAQLSSNAHRGGRPIAVVASTDAPKPVPLEHLLLRLAALIAATETEDTTVTPPFAFDPRKPPVADLDQLLADIRRARDEELRALYMLRLARLERLVNAVSFPISPTMKARLDLRLPQLTYAMLAAEYPVSLESAPETFRRLETLTDQIIKQPDITESAERVPTEALSRIIEQLNLALDDERRVRLDQIRRRINPVALGLPPDTSRDVILEDRLRKQTDQFDGIVVIPEPYSVIGFREDLVSAIADPLLKPRDAASKRKAVVIAVNWLERIASGEVPGYDARPAEPALRNLLTDPELGPKAIDAIANFPSAEVQQDLLGVATAGALPIELRLQAADRCIVHIQKNGKLIPANQARELSAATQGETAPVLKGKLLVIDGLISPNDREFVPLARQFRSPLTKPAPAPAVDPAPAPAPKPPDPN